MSSSTPPSATAHSSNTSSPISPNSKSTPGRKGKAVQWLDDHLNSQAAERMASQQEQSASGTVQIDDQSSSQAASQLARLKEMEAERRNENSESRELNELELEGIQRRERELERIASGEPPMSPHLLDEKGLDPNTFFELTTALERHQSQTSQSTNTNTTSIPPSYSLPTLPPTAFPQSDIGTIEKTKSQQPPQSILASASGGPAPAPGSGPGPVPRVHYFPPRAQPPPSIWSIWQMHKATKTKDYGNEENDRLVGGGAGAGGGGDGYEMADSDVNSLSVHSSYMPPHSGGVLGALLALYNAQNDASLESVPPSGASTPTLQPESLSHSQTTSAAAATAARRAAMQAERECRAEACDAMKVYLGPPNRMHWSLVSAF